jgi:hypothetical protein
VGSMKASLSSTCMLLIAVVCAVVVYLLDHCGCTQVSHLQTSSSNLTTAAAACMMFLIGLWVAR